MINEEDSKFLIDLFKKKEDYCKRLHKIVGKDSEDIFMEALVHFMMNIEKYDETRGTKETWFNSILKSEIWKDKRRLSKQPVFVNIDDWLSSPAMGRVPQQLSFDMMFQIKNAEHQKIVYNHVVLGLTFPENAAQVGVKESKIRKVISRLRKIVKLES